MRPLILVMTEGAKTLARRKLRGARGALEAAQALLAHTLDVAEAIGDVRVSAPAGSDAVELARERGIPWIPQPGGPLGSRIGAALADLRAEEPAYPPRPVLVIGDDCPGLTEECLAEAVIALSRDAPSVVGRARDGGFWLLGLAALDDALARALAADVAWCTPRAFATLDRVLRATVPGRPVLLHEHADLDTLEDLPLAIRAAEDERLRAWLASVRPGVSPPDIADTPLAFAHEGPRGLPRPPPRA